MSDEGERAGRGTDMSDNPADHEESVRVTVPEVEKPEPGGRSDASAAGEDVKVAPMGETPAPEGSGPGPEPWQPAAAGRPEFGQPEAGRPAQRQFDDSLFDGDGDPQYAGVTPTGPSAPPKPGKPSSGNWQMPEWMADEQAADAKLGRSSGDSFDEGGGRGRVALLAGVGVLVLALLAAGAVYLLQQRGDDGGGEKQGASGQTASAGEPQEPQVEMPPDKPLRRFPGRPSRLVGMVTDPMSGLAYPRLAAPWQLPTKANKLGTSGWSGQQVLVTERSGGGLWYGQLLVGRLNPGLQSSYTGPESVQSVAVLAAKNIEAQYYGFPHKSAPLASQALTVDGRKGWLVASYLTYKRAGVRATGEVVATLVVDNGRPVPAVVFASVPNTHRTMWPDINQFFARLRIVAS
ncbi:hypothetical protein [Actinomadura sp. NBRC 104412]|uniref:hypothetical protein n=1 Tax=Actinomadura sp. NBRC 104412 TaxID=3032203 RepID=UPI0025568AA8|nr:hypothetical protein [Actinomadura sp. NBRC 104412]